MKILVFNDLASAQIAEQMLFTMGARIWQQLGAVYDEGSNTVIGRNSASGEPEPERTRTERYAVIEQTPASVEPAQWYFASPRQDLLYREHGERSIVNRTGTQSTVREAVDSLISEQGWMEIDRPAEWQQAMGY